jgi:DNA-binding MarR family transcriptional regulator
MGLKEELGFPKPVSTKAHEALLNIFVTADLLGKEADRVVQPFGLTRSQFDVLKILDHQTSDGSADQSSLGRMLVVNRSNVTGIVDRMERDGLVVRIADPSDRRVKRIRMTPRGRRLFKAADAAYVRRTAEVVSALTPSDFDTVCRLMESIRAALRKASHRKD